MHVFLQVIGKGVAVCDDGLTFVIGRKYFFISLFYFIIFFSPREDLQKCTRTFVTQL